VGFHHIKGLGAVRNLVLFILCHFRIAVKEKNNTIQQHLGSIIMEHWDKTAGIKEGRLRLLMAIRLKDWVPSKIIRSPCRNYHPLKNNATDHTLVVLISVWQFSYKTNTSEITYLWFIKIIVISGFEAHKEHAKNHFTELEFNAWQERMK